MAVEMTGDGDGVGVPVVNITVVIKWGRARVTGPDGEQKFSFPLFGWI